MQEAWAFAHSIECPVSRSFAWRFWTSVENWKLDADVESVELQGPFAAGTEGVTISRSAGKIQWRLASVEAEARALVEFPLPGAMGWFDWTFEDLGDRVRITQRASIAGEQAPAIASAFGPSLETGIPAGMQKLCESMAEAAAGL